MGDALHKAVLTISVDAFVPEAVFPQLVRCDVAAAGQGGQGVDVPGVQGRYVLLGYGLRLLSSPVPRSRSAFAPTRCRLWQQAFGAWQFALAPVPPGVLARFTARDRQAGRRGRKCKGWDSLS